jgi:hypothetical protein
MRRSGLLTCQGEAWLANFLTLLGLLEEGASPTSRVLELCIESVSNELLLRNDHESLDWYFASTLMTSDQVPDRQHCNGARAFTHVLQSQIHVICVSQSSIPSQFTSTP